MTSKICIFAIAGLMLAACGGPDTAEEPATDPAPTVSQPAEPADTTPGALPPPTAFLQDGGAVTGNIGEEISLKFELPDDAPGSMTWRAVEPDYQGVVREDKTWRAKEGSQNYADVILIGESAGNATIIYELVNAGVPVEGTAQRSVTVTVN